MKFLRELHAMSELFFYLFGGLFLMAFLLWKNDVFAYQAELLLRYGDLPFAFLALLFGGTSLRLTFSDLLKEESALIGAEDIDAEHPILDAILIVSGLTLFLGLVYMDFALPNVV